MNRDKLTLYIQLANTQGVGPVGFKRMIQKFHNVENALLELARKKVIFPKQKAEEEIMLAELKNVKIITIDDDEYPYNLRQIDDAPPILYAMGNVELLNNDNAIAIVGSRNASLSALKMAEQMAEELSDKNISIVSGLARGIDAYAHKGALLAKGGTIAVLGTGIDVYYPKENEKLYHEISENGLILTEYPFHTQPQASNFPRRNRIVSGLSKGVIVVEASIQSGSLITAHRALEQGRDVYAIPGAPYDGRASGCNRLIKEGGILVETSDDVINNFNFSPVQFVSGKKQSAVSYDLFEYSLDNAQNNVDIPKKSDDHTKLLELISEQGEDIDELIRLCNLPPEKVLMMIVELELEDKLIRLPGNKVAKS